MGGSDLATAEWLHLCEVTPAEWTAILEEVYGRVSADPRCASIFHDIGPVRFQILLSDRPDLSFWEEYDGQKVVPRLGVTDTCSVEAATTFRVFLGTLLREISIMEAAADEAWQLSGDTEALFRCANLLPYVMLSFSETAAGRLEAASESS
jgi:hypothetical protein